MAIFGPATATATARIAAGPGRRRDENLGRRGFVGDSNLSDLATAAGAAPRLAAVRCILRSRVHLVSETASNPLIPAAPARALLTAIAYPLLPASPGTIGRLRKSRQHTRCAMNAPPPPETPKSFLLAIKLSRELVNEVVRVGKFLWHWIQYLLSQPEMKTVWLEMNKLWNVLRRAILKILCGVLSVINEHSSANGIAAHIKKSRHCRMNLLPPPENPRCFSVVMKLSRELAKEVVTLARFVCHWTQYLLSRPETNKLWTLLRRAIMKILYGVVSLTNEPYSDEVGAAAPARGPPPMRPPGTTSTDGPAMGPASKNPTVGAAAPVRGPPPMRPPGTTSTDGPAMGPAPKNPTVGARKTSRAEHASDSTATQPITEQEPQNLWSKAAKNVKKRINRKARELLLTLIKEDMMKLQKDLKRLFITNVMCTLVIFACLWACREVASQSDRAVACQLLAVECMKALVRYNLPDKLVGAGHFLYDRGLLALKACKEAERSYKIHEKLLLVWMRAVEGGKVAGDMSTIFANFENLCKILGKIAKGGK